MKKIFLIFILGITGLLAGSGAALAISAPNLIAPANNATLAPGNIPFEWEPVPGAAAYYYRILNKETGDKYTGQDNYEGTKKIIPDFFALGTYKWLVGACEGRWPYFWPFGSCSTPSERTFTTINLETLPKPTPTSPCSTQTTLIGTSLRPEMRWEWKGKELQYYSLEITGNLVGGDKKRTFGTILQNYFLIPTSVLQNNEPYDWRIQATNKNNQKTDWSDPCSFLTELTTTPVPPPSVPPRIDSISLNKGQWNKVTPIDIVGDNFDFLTCSNNVISFNVGQGATGATGVTRSALPDSCLGATTLKVTVPSITEGITSANNIIKIKVSIKGKESNEVDFLLEGVVNPPGGTTGGPGQPQLNVAWPRNPLGKDMPIDNLPKLIEYIYGWGISLAGFAAFIVLVIAGFQYLTSAGNPGKMQESMDRVKSAGLGIILLFGSVLVLNTINPQLTTLKMPVLSPQIQECSECKNSYPNSWEKDCKQKCNLIIDVEKNKIDINQNCNSGVDVYNASDGCQGQASGHVGTDSGGVNFNCPVNGKCSIKTAGPKNMCFVEFYGSAGCSGKSQTLFIGDTCTNLTQYFNEDIGCIKVKNP